MGYYYAVCKSLYILFAYKSRYYRQILQITRKENLPKYAKTQRFAYYWQILENR